LARSVSTVAANCNFKMSKVESLTEPLC
jgi:hypothetical protein